MFGDKSFLRRVTLAPEQLTNEELAKKIAVAIQEWPLYRQLHYTGAGAEPQAPGELRLFCSHAKCGFETAWRLSENLALVTKFPKGNYSRPSHIDDYFHAKYICKNCGTRVSRYFFYWSKVGAEGWFFKVGQSPELQESVSKALEEKLDSEDLKVYKNALRMRNFNFGIAAVAYMRRVVENRMSDMLDVLYEAARAHNASQAVLARHEEMMKEKRFTERVNYAGDLLPESLRPKGQPNPMAILHELASDGLHTKSDAECVDIFDACRQTFEYVFGKVRLENEEAKKFVAEMTALSGKRSSIAQARPDDKTPEKV